MSKIRQGDSLNQLNVDETELTFKEKNMIDMLYPSSSSPSSSSPSPTSPSTSSSQPPLPPPIIGDSGKVWHHFKDILLATGLFVALSLPFADSLIAKFVKVDDPNYRLAAKAIVFALLLFVIHNFYLARQRGGK